MKLSQSDLVNLVLFQHAHMHEQDMALPHPTTQDN